MSQDRVTAQSLLLLATPSAPQMCKICFPLFPQSKSALPEIQVIFFYCVDYTISEAKE